MIPSIRRLAIATLASAGVVLAPSQAPAQQVYISEFGASNASTIADEDGEYSDWIELHNAGPVAVNLDGWYLTDTVTVKTKWRIPAISLDAGQYLVVWASDKRRAIPGRPLHTNFKLSAGGEYLGLIRPTGAAHSEYAPAFPVQAVDVSYGHGYEGLVLQPAVRRYFTVPTPGGPNSELPEEKGPTVASVVSHPAQPTDEDVIVVTATVLPTARPVASVALTWRINYEPPRTVSMFDDGAHGDGAANDLTYGAALEASASGAGDMVRWKVIATDTTSQATRSPLHSDPTDSPEYWGVVIDDGEASALPILRFFVEDPMAADTDEGTRASVFFASRFYDNVGMAMKGQSSRAWPKKSYKFKLNTGFFLEYDKTKPKIKELNMQSAFSDKSFMRAVLAWETYRNAEVKGSDAFLMQTRMNGRFYSVATFVEEPDERYLEGHGLNAAGALYKMENGGVVAEYLNNEKKTRKHEDYSDLRTFLEGLNAEQGRAAFLFDNVDLPATINYLAATVLFHNNDHVGKNHFLYRDTGRTDEWSMLPWDMDLTFGRNFVPVEGVLSDVIWADNDNMSHPLVGDATHQKVDAFWNRLIDALYSTPPIREMFLRRLRTLMDLQLQAPDTPPGARKYEARIAELRSTLGRDTDRDRLRWGNPYGASQTMDQAADIILNDFLPRRRVHLFETHSSGLGLIPVPQNAPALMFGRSDSSPSNPDAGFLEIENRGSEAFDVSGFRLAGDVTHRLRPGTVIPRQGSLFIAPLAEAFRARETAPKGGQGLFVQGGASGRLSESCGPVTLLDATDAPIAALCGCAPPIQASSSDVCPGAAVTLSTSPAEAYEWSTGGSGMSTVVRPFASEAVSLVTWRSDLKELGVDRCQSARAWVNVQVIPQTFEVSLTPPVSQTFSPHGTGVPLSSSVSGSGTGPFTFTWVYRPIPVSSSIRSSESRTTPVQIVRVEGAQYIPMGADFPGVGDYEVFPIAASACGVARGPVGEGVLVRIRLSVPAFDSLTITSLGPAAVQTTALMREDGGSPLVRRGFVYSQSSINAAPLRGGAGVTYVAVPDSSQEFAATIPLPLPGTRYSIRAVAANEVGETYSDVSTVSTLPRLSAESVSVGEGNEGVARVDMVVTLSNGSDRPVTVEYATQDGTARSGVDYVKAAGRLTFSPGEVSRILTLSVLGDVAFEGNEGFGVTFVDAIGATIGTPVARVMVLDDDRDPNLPVRGQPVWHEFFAVDARETPMVGDFNGDGRADIITFTRQNPLAVGDVYVSLSDGLRFGDSLKWHDFFAISETEEIIIGDYDGDGKDDIATWLKAGTRQVYVALSTGEGMTRELVWAERVGPEAADSLYSGDVNGDGRDDLVAFTRRLGQVHVSLSNGRGFGTPALWNGFFAVSEHERPRVGDLNGDGLSDIVTFATDSPTAYGAVYVALSNGAGFAYRGGVASTADKWHDFFAVQPSEQIQIGDLNADGRSDFFTFLPPPFAQCYTSLSTGSGMGPSLLWPENVGEGAEDRIHLGDVNADGKVDIVIFAQREGRVYVSLTP